MNETLSVIDEHITDMNTPRSSYAQSNKRDTIGSVYSTQPLNRLSYIPGHETDEDDTTHTEEEVSEWSPARVAEYLEDHGVERAHCDVFREQEISGEVLLAMDQSSIFIKEFELGPVGRRLKTWHKVKALQDEVRASAQPGVARSTTSEYSAAPGASAADDRASIVSDAGRNRSSTIGTVLPRGLEPGPRSAADGRSNTMQSTSTSPFTGQGSSAAALARNSSNTVSPLQAMTSVSRADSTYRPSAQDIRQMQHARRHSSIDSTHSATRSHRKQPSFDRAWQPGQAQANGRNLATVHTRGESATHPRRESSLSISASPADLDRGYFSSNDLEQRSSSATRANVLTKTLSNTSSTASGRRNSFLFAKQSAQAIAHRVIHADDQPTSPLHHPTSSEDVWTMLNSLGSPPRSPGSLSTSPVRSATTPMFPTKPAAGLASPASPIVTKLDHQDRNISIDALAASSAAMAGAQNAKKDETTSPTIGSGMRGLFGKKSKPAGLRAISDAVTKNERTTALKEGETVNSPTRTGSTTPSTETRSFDMRKSVDGQSRTSTGSAKLMPPPPTTKRPRPKTKKATSAYTRGLEKRPPAEQISGCDYSGWMKKKSGSLMTTWKSRLFVLRGRRLSYYYQDDDTEEKGLIDISFHRVLPATNEMLTGMHAAITGAAGSPSSPTSTATTTNAQRDLQDKPPLPGEGGESGIFIFKLVPPKSGLSKGVTFTKPTVHYFAVNSRQEGRLWMAALMKATIDRDDDGLVTTTYNQKTISLNKARARKERPPALQELQETPEEPPELDGLEAEEVGKGLGIDGLMIDNVLSGAEQEREKDGVDGASFTAPASTTETTETNASEELDEHEKEAVALHSVS